MSQSIVTSNSYLFSTHPILYFLSFTQWLPFFVSLSFFLLQKKKKRSYKNYEQQKMKLLHIIAFKWGNNVLILDFKDEIMSKYQHSLLWFLYSTFPLQKIPYQSLITYTTNVSVVILLLSLGPTICFGQFSAITTPWT